MTNVADDHVLNSDVEYALVATVAVMLLPCILMNSYIIWKILKQNNYKVFSIVPKTVNLYYNIAICDALLGIFVMPWVIYYILIGRPAPIVDDARLDANMTATLRELSEAHETYRDNTAHRAFCVLCGYIYNVLTRVTSLTVLLLSIDRTHAIYFPLTYSRDIYYSIYRYCTYIIWGFALGIQALPFFCRIPYVEQHTRELTCSWSISQLLGIEPDEVDDNKVPILVLYFILVLFPLVIPTITSVFLCAAVFIKILYKRYQYISEKLNTAMMLSETKEKHSKRSYLSNMQSVFRLRSNDSKESHQVKSLTKASYTMLLMVLMYIVFFAYYWLMCITNTLYLLGVKMSGGYMDMMMYKPFWVYMHSSFHISIFLHCTFTPFLVYYRVIINFTAKKSSSSNKYRPGRSKTGKTVDTDNCDGNGTNKGKNKNLKEDCKSMINGSHKFV